MGIVDIDSTTCHKTKLELAIATFDNIVKYLGTYWQGWTILGLTLKMSKECQEMLKRAKVAIGRQSTCWAMLNEYGLVWPNIHDDNNSNLDEVEPIQVSRPNVGIMVGSFFKPIKIMDMLAKYSVAISTTFQLCRLNV